jgi:hypothetical protein
MDIKALAIQLTAPQPKIISRNIIEASDYSTITDDYALTPQLAPLSNGLRRPSHEHLSSKGANRLCETCESVVAWSPQEWGKTATRERITAVRGLPSNS